MSSKTVASGRVFDLIGGGFNKAFLRYRVGVAFPAETSPALFNAHNMVPLIGPRDAMRQIYYCPARGVDLLEELDVDYPVDYSVAHAPRAELFLNQRAGHIVWFGRFGEERAFSFDVEGGHHYLRLSINRHKNGGFVPLYISVRKEEEVRYFRLDVKWFEEMITVSIRHVKEEDVPEFLRFRGEVVYEVESPA